MRESYSSVPIRWERLFFLSKEPFQMLALSKKIKFDFLVFDSYKFKKANIQLLILPLIHLNSVESYEDSKK